jgi:hypothetical protein
LRMPPEQASLIQKSGRERSLLAIDSISPTSLP